MVQHSTVDRIVLGSNPGAPSAKIVMHDVVNIDLISYCVDKLSLINRGDGFLACRG